MRVSGILASKGSRVSTIATDALVRDAAGELRLRGIGALVVSDDGRDVQGIISERDVVIRLAERGAFALDEPVRNVMATDVRTCAPDDDAEELMRLMTEYRVRHLPVLVDGVLSGIVSIGDVVKCRVTELEDHARHLHEYITTGR